MNRLAEVRNEEGSFQKNRYDGEGLRAELEENGRLVSFIFDGDKVVTEEEDQNTIRYIRGYDLISSDSERARTYYHYACDEMGSITHVTDEAGAVLNRYEYDAFGEFTCKEETVANRFAYTGEQYDPVAGMYYLRARFYNPVIGRFLQEDTYYGDGLNLYAYCHNNPVGYVDPSGHAGEMCDAKKAAISELKRLGVAEDQIENTYQIIRHGYDSAEETLKALQTIYSKNNIPYRDIFFEKNPSLRGKVWVHHSIEQQVLKLYPGLFNKVEINAYEMFRGIPKEYNSLIHLNKIRKAWDAFYDMVDSGEIEKTRENFLNKAREIDELYGEYFTPF